MWGQPMGIPPRTPPLAHVWARPTLQHITKIFSPTRGEGGKIPPSSFREKGAFSATVWKIISPFFREFAIPLPSLDIALERQRRRKKRRRRKGRRESRTLKRRIMLEDAYLTAGFVYMEKSIVLFTKNMGSDFCAFFIFWSGGGKAGGVACFNRGGSRGCFCRQGDQRQR